MYTIEKILKAHDVKVNIINSSKGVLIMADNEDGTFTKFKPETSIKKVKLYLGY